MGPYLEPYLEKRRRVNRLLFHCHTQAGWVAWPLAVVQAVAVSLTDHIRTDQAHGARQIGDARGSEGRIGRPPALCVSRHDSQAGTAPKQNTKNVALFPLFTIRMRFRTAGALRESRQGGLGPPTITQLTQNRALGLPSRARSANAWQILRILLRILFARNHPILPFLTLFR